MASDECSKVEVMTVDVIRAKDLVASSGHRYLDVRTEAEFNKAHPDAGEVLNIRYMFITPEGRVKNPQFLEQVSSAYSQDDKIIVGCQSGAMSLAAAGDLLNAGYKHVYNIGGGHLAWVEKGLPVKQTSLNGTARLKYCENLTASSSLKCLSVFLGLGPMDDQINGTLVDLCAVVGIWHQSKHCFKTCS